jgi:hypothetical protein
MLLYDSKYEGFGMRHCKGLSWKGYMLKRCLRVGMCLCSSSNFFKNSLEVCYSFAMENLLPEF